MNNKKDLRYNETNNEIITDKNIFLKMINHLVLKVLVKYY